MYFLLSEKTTPLKLKSNKRMSNLAFMNSFIAFLFEFKVIYEKFRRVTAVTKYIVSLINSERSRIGRMVPHTSHSGRFGTFRRKDF